MLLGLLAIGACGTEPEVDPVLGLEFDLIDVNARTGAYYYLISPSLDDVRTDWEDALRPGWCVHRIWLSVIVPHDWPRGDLVRVANGQPECADVIAEPDRSIVQTRILGSGEDEPAQWIWLQAQVRGEGSHHELCECWYSADDGFRQCHDSPIDDGAPGRKVRSMRAATTALLALLVLGCGTEPEPALDLEIEFDTFDQRAEKYYYQITPTRGGNPVEWADVLRTGQCLDKRWMAFWVGEETHGIIGSISCVSPIARPSSSSLAAELTHPVSSLVGNWIGIKVRIKGGHRQRALAGMLVLGGGRVSEVPY